MATLFLLIVLLLLLLFDSITYSIACPKNTGHKAEYEAFRVAKLPSNMFFPARGGRKPENAEESPVKEKKTTCEPPHRQ